MGHCYGRIVPRSSLLVAGATRWRMVGRRLFSSVACRTRFDLSCKGYGVTVDQSGGGHFSTSGVIYQVEARQAKFRLDAPKVRKR